jgi:hypothetical protein
MLPGVKIKPGNLESGPYGRDAAWLRQYRELCIRGSARRAAL